MIKTKIKRILIVIGIVGIVMTLGATGVIAADGWLGIGSAELDSYCGDNGVNTLPGTLDANDFWVHVVNETHWFILDLGQIYTIKKVRGRSVEGDDPIDVDIFVSNSTSSWGAAVTTTITTWQDGAEPDTQWVEITTTEKNGRYVKVAINDTESAVRTINWGAYDDDWNENTIFDAYGDIAPPVANEPSMQVYIIEEM